MAITINDNTKSELKNPSLNNNTNKIEIPSEQRLVGITDSFKYKFNKEIKDYCNNIKSAINKFDEIPINVFIKGESIETELRNFINSIKNIANSYIEKLQLKEEEIINGVYLAYAEQDSDVSSDIKSNPIV